MYLVFLDIDGVFTSNRMQFASDNPHDMWVNFDPVAVSFMNRIHDSVANVKFMLISTWKTGLRLDDPFISHWVLAAFRNAGFRGNFDGTWKSNPDNLPKFPTRAHEIKDYLDSRPTVKDFIIFDDNDYSFDRVLGKRRFIKTDPVNGLLHKHMLNAMSIIGAWE